MFLKKFKILLVCACSDFSLSVEDVVLVEQMNELGLPLSFQTNKEVI